MNVTWWCSAQNAPWSWTWQAYPGVWLVVGSLIVGYVATARRAAGRTHVTPGQGGSFALGVLLVWAMLDWPLGPLAAGYLASVHTAQYLVLALIVPPLLLHGSPPWMLRQWLGTGVRLRIARGLTRPLIAFAIFNVVMVATHLPAVVDTLKVSQLGSFAIDVSWAIAGFAFWIPIMAPLPELAPMRLPGRIIFAMANLFLPTVPASFLTFAEYPIYALYELAPRVSGLSAVQDQQIAGLTMKIGGGLVIFTTASILFFQWYRREEDKTAI
ncbi:MAG TPA: cytochrome c oxidase assembly protein [Gemmatimonadales bacterium]